MTTIMLGKHVPKKDKRTLQFEKYTTPHLPERPKEYHWSPEIVDWHMMGNDKLGDCTVWPLLVTL